MDILTRQQRTVLAVVTGLLLTGWAVKAWRSSHPETSSRSPVAGKVAGSRS